MMTSCNHLTEILHDVLRGDRSPEELTRATQDYLEAYADTRGEIVYGALGGKSPDVVRANRLAASVLKGQFIYPFTDEGIPMVAGMVICRPDGSKAVLTRIEIDSPRYRTHPITLYFDDALSYNGAIIGFHVPRIG